MKIRPGRHRSLTYKRGRRLKQGDKPAKPLGWIGRVIGALFFGIFLAAGLFFAVIMTRELTADTSAKSWPSTHGELIQADIVINASSNDPFSLTAEYQFTVNGTAYTGKSIQRNRAHYSDYRKAQLRLDALRDQTPLKVYYHPDDPRASILRHASGWQYLMLLLPLVFIVIGGGGMVGMLFARGGKKDEESESISEQATGLGNKTGAFFLIFAASGMAFMSFFIKPAIYTLTSGDWPEIPCKILYSQLRSYDSDDGTTYKADILFEYEYEGKTYRSNKVEFMGGSSSGTKGKRKTLKAYPRGSERTCFVNPGDPTLAVLKREFSPMYFFMLLPLIFVVIGVGGFAKWLWNRHAPEPTYRDSPRSSRSQKPSILTGTGEVELKSKQHRITQFIFLLIFAAFWNGITFGFLVREVIETWQDSKPDWFMTLFCIPFVAVGIGIAVGAFVQLLKMFNPVLHLYVSQPDIAPGESMTIRWQMRGGLKPVEELTIRMVGEEVTRYRRGTTTYTDRHTFFEEHLVEGGRFQEVDRGNAKLSLPADVMHSFDQPDNKIVWSLKAHGTIHFWPDVSIDYEVPVTPRSPAS